MLGAMQMILALRLSKAIKILTASVISLPSKTPHPLSTTPTRADMICSCSSCDDDYMSAPARPPMEETRGFRKRPTSISLCAHSSGEGAVGNEPSPHRYSALAAHYSSGHCHRRSHLHAICASAGPPPA